MVGASIPAVFREQVAKLRSRPMVYGKRDRHWRPLTWIQMGDRVAEAAGGLCALGIKPGDRVAILAESGPEWVLADLAIASAGACVVSIYETSTAEQAGFMLADSESCAVFVSRQAQLDKICHEIERDPGRLSMLRQIITFDASLKDPGLEGIELRSLVALEAEGEGYTDEVDQRVAALGADDLLTFIYTSGTTGVPKAVMLTHGNLLANCEATARAIPVRSDDVLLSFLPLSHSFERMAGYYMAALFGGATIYYAEGLGRLIQNLRDVRPTVMTGVPRVYEKIYARFMGFRARANPVERRAIDLALWVGGRVSKIQQTGRQPGFVLQAQYRLAHERVFAQLKDRLGGRIRFLVSGGAPLAAEVGAFFHAAGLQILEGYGLTETAPVLTVNRLEAYKFGSVGQPLDNVRLRIADDGEIVVRGPNVMQGYYGHPQETAEVLSDGWLLTGDIGHIDQDGFLYITDRKKDLFKTAGGKYIAPQHLERLLMGRRFIEQACIVGDRRPYCVALLVPAIPALRAWAREREIDDQDITSLLVDPAVARVFRRAVDEVNAGLARHETIKAFRLLVEPFSAENGLLTPSHKVRRRAVIEQYGAQIEGLYATGFGGRRR